MQLNPSMAQNRRCRIFYPSIPYPAHEGSYIVAFEQLLALAAQGWEIELWVWNETAATIGNNGLKQLVLSHCPACQFSIHLLGSGQLPVNAAGTKKTIDRVKRTSKALLGKWASTELYYYPTHLWRSLPESPCELEVFHYSFSAVWLLQARRRVARKTVVFYHNLESDLARIRELEEKNFGKRLIHRRNTERLLQHERQLLSQVDETWWVSGRDYHLLTGHTLPSDPKSLSREKGRWVPPTIPKEWWISQDEAEISKFWVKEFKANSNLQVGVVGALDYQPNRQGLIWILEKVCPLLSLKGFAGKIHVVGRGADEELLGKLREYPFIEVHGFVEDLNPLWKNWSLSLVADVAGSGVRMKLLESMSRGVQVLATSAALLRLHPGIEACPGVHVSDREEVWVDWLMGHSHEVSVSQTGFMKWLDRDRIYRFLLSEGSKP